MNKKTIGLLYGLCLLSRVAAQATTEKKDSTDDKDENVTLAVILSLAAGLATTIGGATPFFPQLRKIAEAKILASSLALASGVMLYVSFVEIFVKSNDSISLGLGHVDGEGEKIGFRYPGDKYGNLYTTLAFFGGCIVVMLLHQLVHLIAPVTDKLEDHDVIQHHEERSQASQQPPNEPVDEESASAQGPAKFDDEKEKAELKQMGVLTAVALGLHNFPEGFATFIATLEEPSLGAALAVAIAIHNIPEGICVAMPVYYATGSKWKGFGWAFLSGLSEPIGGILGWLALRSVFTDTVFGVIFGMVGGMMVWIVLGELLPTAIGHDKSGKLVPPFLFGGMVLISASLIAFAFA
eukprot:TRINITY_DN8697_c1_g4_i1.p1 TRINITY_DN8697_c1_g4~~TRINITY_DN8697_c1_g4_i1.p1  ORF type:complete len:352 (+),score=106.30 TRINITY_DN8697_c1_g4_i1:39-1094(+)